MNNAVNKVSVEPRTIYSFGKRRSRVFDASLVVNGEKFSATAPTKKEAVEAVLADVEYVRTARRLEGNGCKLYAQGKQEWVFVLPSGGSMCFGAADLWAAFDRVSNDYRDHEDCQLFLLEGRLWYESGCP